MTGTAVDKSRHFSTQIFLQGQIVSLLQNHKKAMPNTNQNVCKLSTRFPNLVCFPSIDTLLRATVALSCGHTETRKCFHSLFVCHFLPGHSLRIWAQVMDEQVVRPTFVNNTFTVLYLRTFFKLPGKIPGVETGLTSVTVHIILHELWCWQVSHMLLSSQ